MVKTEDTVICMCVCVTGWWWIQLWGSPRVILQKHMFMRSELLLSRSFLSSRPNLKLLMSLRSSRRTLSRREVPALFPLPLPPLCLALLFLSLPHHRRLKHPWLRLHLLPLGCPRVSLALWHNQVLMPPWTLPWPERLCWRPFVLELLPRG